MINLFCRVEVYGWIAFFVSLPFGNKTNAIIPQCIEPSRNLQHQRHQRTAETESQMCQYWETNLNDNWGNRSKSNLKKAPNAPENFKTARQRAANTGRHNVGNDDDVDRGAPAQWLHAAPMPAAAKAARLVKPWIRCSRKEPPGKSQVCVINHCHKWPAKFVQPLESHVWTRSCGENLQMFHPRVLTENIEPTDSQASEWVERTHVGNNLRTKLKTSCATPRKKTGKHM